MKIFGKRSKLFLGAVIFLQCFAGMVLADSWYQRACLRDSDNSTCKTVSQNFKEPYCIMNIEGGRTFANDCIIGNGLANIWSPGGEDKAWDNINMSTILEKYCSLLYSSDGGRVYFAKPNGQTSGRDWQQTFDSHQSLFLYALCSSFKDKDGNTSFLKENNIPIGGVFTGDLSKLLKLQQITQDGKNLCSLDKDDSPTLNDCDMAIYATKIYEAIMTDLYKIKYAQVLNVDAFSDFEVTKKVEDFMIGYKLRDKDKDYKALKELYPKTLSILESNQMFYRDVLGTVKIIDNSTLANRAIKTKCPATGNMTGVDFVACALHSSQGNKFALTPSFVTLLYNEVLHYRLFITYHQLWLKNNAGRIDNADGKRSDFGWYFQKQIDATKRVQHDFENFNMTYPLHIGLLMYIEKVEEFRNKSLSKLITSFYSLSEKLQNVQQLSSSS